MGQLLRREELNGEALDNFVRIIVALFLWGSLLDRQLSSRAPVLPEVLGLAPYTAYIIGTLVILHRRRYHPAMAYVSVGLGAVMTAFYMVLGPAGVGWFTPASVLFLLVLGIASAALRHRPGLVLYAGVVYATAAAVAGLYLLSQTGAGGARAMQLRPFGTTELVQRSLFLLAAALPLIYTARVSREMIRTAGVASQQQLRAVMQLNSDLEYRVLAQRAILDERARIAREIHDGLAKSLSGLALEAGALERMVGDSDGEVREKVSYLAELSRHLVHDARGMIYDVRATMGAGTLLEQLRVRLEDWQRKTGTQVDLEVKGRLDSTSLKLKYEVLRIADEALANVQRHARATAVTVNVLAGERWLEVAIRDDGIGFVPDDEGSLIETAHFGLVGMRERARHLGGTLRLETAPGAGTTVRLRVPLAEVPESIMCAQGGPTPSFGP